MSKELEYMLMEENDTSEGMGAILWIVASLAAIVLTTLSIIIMN